ncbi:MAG: efflux RND transporter periplasmic adaptor subunit [Myxococcales bacterium]|nr:efflux RND transporter periplasmic adaptor subunit [Myxococcales bacterium]
MQRNYVPVALAGSVGLAFLATLLFLVARSRPVPDDIQYVQPTVADIVLKTVATGAIVPRVEVEIKSRVSGVLSTLHVEPGHNVRSGDLIAEIQIIPDSATLNNAQASMRTAKIQLDAALQELERAEGLSAQAALSSAELARARRDHDLARQSYSSAWSNLQIVKEGATRGSGNVSTEVRSTVSGMVLAAGVEEGESVTETNTFNAGTTIASVADMTDMVFEGYVDESEVGRIRESMPLDITVGALQNRTIRGSLEYISPKGVMVDGAVQFAIRAAIAPEDDLFIRAGSSANADIVLDRREQVMAIDERALRFDDGETFVEVEISPGEFEVRPVEVGLSDGIQIEVVGGLQGDERLKAGASG